MPEEKKKRVKPVVVETSSQPQPVVLTPPQVVVPETNNIVPPSVPQNSKNVFFTFFIITFIVAIFIAALAGGIFVYYTGLKKISPQTLPTPTNSGAIPTSSPEPSASPSAKLNLSDYKVAILNGSGQIGAAGSAKIIVEKGGFKVIYTGNADNFNYTDTVINFRNTISSDVVSSLKDLLSQNYSVKLGTGLPASSIYDIMVNVGSK